MNSHPLISVIVPVYNCEKYLSQCIESILAQTYINLQIILIDDGSKDNSGKICDTYAEKDTRIEVIHQANSGVSVARNAGLKVVRGEYIGFVDSDDYLAPSMYTYLYQLIEVHQVPIAICNFYNLSIEKQVESVPLERVITIWKGSEILAHCFNQMFSWNKLFSRSLFAEINFNPNCGYGEDIYVCTQLFEKASLAVYGPQAKYYYRKYGNTATTSLTWNPNYLTYFSETMHVIEYAKKQNLQRVVKKFKESRLLLAVSFLHRCIQTTPFDEQSAHFLQQYIRKNILYFVFHIHAKISKKIFALCSVLNLYLTKFLCLHIKRNL